MKENVIITMQSGSSIYLDPYVYKAIADHVRTADRTQLAMDVLSLNLSCEDKNLENLENYVLSDNIRLNAFAEMLDTKLEEKQGEKEYDAVQALREEYRTALYRIISNKGTSEEQQDEAVLPKELAEILTIQDGLKILSTDGDMLDSTYIDEVEYVGTYD